MAGIMQNIKETLHMGGDKKPEDAHKKPTTGGEYSHDKKAEEHKQGGGFLDKVKEKIPGGEKHGTGTGVDGEKKKKKKDKKKSEGHDGGSSSSSDSD